MDLTMNETMSDEMGMNVNILDQLILLVQLSDVNLM